MAGVWELPGLSPTLRLLLLALADHANDDGVCWPSYRTLEARVGLSGRQLRRLIGEAESEGYITRRRGGRGPGDVTHYTLTVRGTRPSPIRGTPASPYKGDTRDRKGDTGVQIRGTPASLEPSMNHQLEPGMNEPTKPIPVAEALRRARVGFTLPRQRIGAGAHGADTRAPSG